MSDLRLRAAPFRRSAAGCDHNGHRRGSVGAYAWRKDPTRYFLMPGSPARYRWHLRCAPATPAAVLGRRAHARASADRERARWQRSRLLRCRTSHRALVGVDDLTPGGEPHALALLHVSDCALQVFDAQGLADDHRMQRNAHDPRLLAAVGVQRIELIDHRAQILLAGVALAEEERDVVDLVAVGNREHFSRFDLHLIGLVVVVPVAAILHAFFGENVERVVGLYQPGAEPAARPLPGRLLDRLQDRANGLALLLRGKAGERVRVGETVAHELPAALLHFLDRLGEDFANLRIQRDGRL